MFITVFINFSNLFFYWNRKGFVLFCVFPKISNCCSNSFANSFIRKWLSQSDPLWKTRGNLLGTLKLKLDILVAALLYLPVKWQMVSNFLIVFIFTQPFWEPFSTNEYAAAFWCSFSLFLNSNIFFFSKLITFIACSL